MDINTKTPHATWRSLGLAGICTAVMLAVGRAAAQAGQCLADKVITAAGSNPPHGAAMTPQGTTDTVIGKIDLRQELSVGASNRLLRLRRLALKPGGVVPWHSHGNRPALIYIVEGKITEYASTCAVPILHCAGETALETHATAHWWKNNGHRPAVLLSADLFPTAGENMDEHMM